MALDYEKCQKWARIASFIGAGIAIILGIAKMFKIMDVMTPIDYITNVYLILLGIAWILCEIPINVILNQFNFMQFYIGKAAFALFLGLLCFNSHKWFTITVGVVLFVVFVLYLILGIIFFNNEKGKVGENSTGTNVVKVNVKS